LIAIAFKENGLYKIRNYILNKESNVTINQRLTEKAKFHRILGHVNFKYLETICKDKLVEGLPIKLESEFLKCGTCIQAKVHNLKFENQRERANECFIEFINMIENITGKKIKVKKLRCDNGKE